MKCLAVDTSGGHLTVALINDEVVTSEFIMDMGLRHSLTLMPTIENVLKKANVEIKDVDVFACVLGPGSFTGIRIGVSTMKAFQFAFNKKVLGVTSFDVLAYNKSSGKNIAVIDAHHGNYYSCIYNGTKAVFPPSFINEEELKNLSNEYEILSSTDTSLSKSNANLLDGFINAIKDKISLATNDSETLMPLYVRKSQAEEGL